MMKANFIGPFSGTSDRIIVSCGIGPEYSEDFAVTVRNCNLHCSDVWRLYYSDYPDGCPTQKDRQYAFKIYAIDAAIKAGFRYILWIDSSLAPIYRIDPLWHAIARDGWYVPPQFNGITHGREWRRWESTVHATLSEWCSDAALSVFGISRTDAKAIPLVMTGLLGLDMGNPLGRRIWQSHRALYDAGVFDGPHNNWPGMAARAVGRKLSGHVSHDKAVLGHRHDETSMSFILHGLGLVPRKRGFLTLEDETGFIAQFAGKLRIQYKGRAA
jgi:hypothetical protein